ncbi:MAG: hypothetical protein VX988_12825 [Planctomycetota bacterium]|nr:hypothetical protein [Planctomycetota bacterium]
MPVYSPAIFHGNNDKSQRKKFADAYTKQIIPRHIVDLFIARILQDQESSNPGDAEAIVRNLIENDCLAPEMLAGLKFNVNRLFGNGRDDDTEEGSPGHGIVDEPAEIGRELLYGKLGDNGVADVAEATQAENGGPYRHPFDSVRPDFNRDGNFSPSVDAAGGNLQRRYAAYHGGEPQANGSIAYGGDYSVRQDYARQLYCLMLAVVDEDAILAHYLGPDGDVDDERQVRIAHEKFARHVAQYAVNVVDFRDPDAIMTPFRYDPFPFVDGWDTNPSTENFDGSPRLVWGCETPVALLSESLALHDRGLKNAIKDAIPSDDPEMAGGWMASTEDDSDHKVADGDAHFDQDRVPRGSAFFEVYCPASPHRPHSAELFTNGKLDLARMDDGGNGDNPVWRIAISAPHVTTVNDQRPTPSISDIIKDPIARKKLYMEPPAPRDADAGVGEILAYTAPFLAGERGDIEVQEIRIRADRYIWFSTNVPTNNSDATYFNQFEGGNDPNTLLSPGEYVVVGPRTHTIISHLEDDDPKNRQMIKLAPEAGTALEGKIHVTNGDRSSDYPANAQIKVPKAIICKTKPATPPGWDSPIAMGLNVSEPLRANYYPKPDKLSQILDGNPNPEIINDGHRYSRRITENDDEGVPLDVPLDQPDGMNANGVGGNSPVALIMDTRLPWDPDFLKPWEGVQDLTGQDPLPDRNDTKMNYRTAFLQRLANPTLPYHPVDNPYMTVDWIPVDLTVYNRDEARSGTVELRSRERGRTLLAGTNPDVYARNLWWPAIIDPTGSQASTGHAFAADLIHSLGFLNRTFSSAPNVTVDRIDTADWFSTAGGAAYVGDPQTPFPWLVWNDRPFISQFELMQVPSTSAGFLGLEFTSVHSANVSSSPVNLNPYRNFNNTYKNNAPIIAFGHLMNFFHSLKGQQNPGIQLGRVFDFMHVPSYYSNSHTALNATDLMGEDGVDQRNPEAPDSNFDKKKNYAPPYNYISNYREPGRVNLNTIYDARVWWALMHGRKDPRNNEHLEDQRHPGPSWEAFVRHRRGYTSGNDMESRILAREPTNQLAGQQQDFYPVNAPSYFCLPYRSQGNYDLHPYINYRDLDNGVVVDTVDFTGVDASLLRRHVLALDFSINLGTDFPLFRDTTDGFKDKPEKSYADSSANSYFKYQPINRLGNLTTTRSNVYAVWITVGYFEVSTPPRWGTDNFVNNFIYPDGYQIGRELGEDTGDIKRHRAFYMVDRTIPVGYENGHDHNVDEVILLRRQIE